MKILFAATGKIAVPVLNTLHGMNLVKAVLTSPDERGGRGNKIIESPVKERARELGLPLYQPEHLRREEREHVKTLSCDTLLSFCYGKIFGPKFLSLFERKYNIHPSALPLYRGPSPLYETIRNAEKTSAITIQEIALEVDSGDIINKMGFDLDGTENIAILEEKVSLYAAALAEETFSRIDSYTKTEQKGNATYSRLIKKEDGLIDFKSSAEAVHAQIRACYPWPRAYTRYKGANLIISSVYGSVFEISEKCSEAPGTVVSLDKKKGLKVATKDKYIYIARLQLPGKKEMDALSFVNGERAIIGSVLGLKGDV